MNAIDGHESPPTTSALLSLSRSIKGRDFPSSLPTRALSLTPRALSPSPSRHRPGACPRSTLSTTPTPPLSSRAPAVKPLLTPCPARRREARRHPPITGAPSVPVRVRRSPSVRASPSKHIAGVMPFVVDAIAQHQLDHPRSTPSLVRAVFARPWSCLVSPRPNPSMHHKVEDKPNIFKLQNHVLN